MRDTDLQLDVKQVNRLYPNGPTPNDVKEDANTDFRTSRVGEEPLLNTSCF